MKLKLTEQEISNIKLLDIILKNDTEKLNNLIIECDYDKEIKEIIKEIIVEEAKILQCLKVNLGDNGENEDDAVAHYTTATIAKLLIKGSKFRLSSTFGVNDPKEGKVLFDYLRRNKIDLRQNKNNAEKLRFEKKLNILPFVACFTFNHDSLNQFRLYGKEDDREATGVSITLTKDFFADNLYRCIYLDPAGKIDTKPYVKIARRNELTFYKAKINSTKRLQKYKREISNKRNYIERKLICISKLINHLYNNDKIKNDNKINLEIKKIITLILFPLNYLIKHSAYEEEQECRIIEFLDIQSEKIVIDDNLKIYIEYKPKQGEIKDSIERIYLSPGAAKYAPALKIILGDEKKVKHSSAPFRIK